MDTTWNAQTQHLILTGLMVVVIQNLLALYQFLMQCHIYTDAHGAYNSFVKHVTL